MSARSLRVAGLVTLALLAARGGLAWQQRRAERLAAASLSWQEQPTADALARESGRPLLYDFSAQWCAPCRRLQRDVFEQPGHAAWIGSRFVAVRVEDGWEGDGLDDEAGAALRQRHRIEAFPTLLVLRDGREVGRLTGYPSPEGVLEFLERSAAEGDGSR